MKRTIALLALCLPACVTTGDTATPETGASAARSSGRVDAGWMATVQARIANTELRLTPDAAGFAGRNRADGRRFRLDDRGVLLDVGAEAEASVSLGLAGWTDGLEHMDLPPVAPVEGGCDESGRLDAFGRCLSRVERRWAGVIEWWENRDDGLHQGFEIAEAPVTGTLRLRFAVEGAQALADEAGAVLLAAGGEAVRWHGVAAWDARGTALDTWIGVDEGGLYIEVDTEGAVGPVTVDPVFDTPLFAAYGPAAGAGFGASVAHGAFIDSYYTETLVVGAPDYDSGRGAVFAFTGSEGVWSTTAAWSAEGACAGAEFGTSVSLGNSGLVRYGGDLIVGAPGDRCDGRTGRGRAYLYAGATTGTPDTTLDVTLRGTDPNGRFGTIVNNAANLMLGDETEIAVTDPYADSGTLVDAGAAYLFLSPVNATDTTAGWAKRGPDAGAHLGASLAVQDQLWHSSWGGIHSWSMVVGAPDTDVGGVDSGAVWWFRGETSHVFGTAGARVYRGSVGERCGAAVAMPGNVDGNYGVDLAVGCAGADRIDVYVDVDDSKVPRRLYAQISGADLDPDRADIGGVLSTADVDGDGFADVLAGAPASGGVGGAVYAFYGGADGMSAADSSVLVPTDSTIGLGEVVVGLGDLDGDGREDVAVGLPGDDTAGADAGALVVWQGDSILPEPDWSVSGSGFSDALGLSLAALGDVQGDGYDDVAVGAPYAGTAGTDGIVYVFHGSASGLSPTADWTASTGDTNFGNSVAGIDGNCDGYGDLLVGAPDTTTTYTRAGRASLFVGGPSGFGTRADWRTSVNQDDASTGYAVANAGDVNNDGCDDLLVGAPSFDSGTVSYAGRALLFLGGSGGPSTSPAYTQDGVAAADQIGETLGAAGDVNGDGYDDVLIGSWGWGDLEGLVEVHLGTSTGVSSTASLTLIGAPWTDLGYANGHGDFDGDGYHDIALAALDDYDTLPTTVSVWNGSASSMSTTPDWSWTSADFGGDVGIAPVAGDLDGDGYDDLVVGITAASGGAAGGGGVAIFYGGPSGLGSSPDAEIYGIDGGAAYGSTVSVAGDVNGDGALDLLVGAPYADVGSTLYAGRTALWYGPF